MLGGGLVVGVAGVDGPGVCVFTACDQCVDITGEKCAEVCR